MTLPFAKNDILLIGNIYFSVLPSLHSINASFCEVNLSEPAGSVLHHRVCVCVCFPYLMFRLVCLCSVWTRQTSGSVRQTHTHTQRRMKIWLFSRLSGTVKVYWVLCGVWRTTNQAVSVSDVSKCSNIHSHLTLWPNSLGIEGWKKERLKEREIWRKDKTKLQKKTNYSVTLVPGCCSPLGFS